MNAVTRILRDLQRGDAGAAAQLLPVVYAELRQLASQRLSREPAGQTLQATDLVHEAYLRLVDVEQPQQWHGRDHFFAAAAEAMRRILIESARRKHRLKHGGDRKRIDLDNLSLSLPTQDDQSQEWLLALDDALTHLEATDPQCANLVKLRFFAGLTMPEAAAATGVSLRNAERNWAYARAWLHRAMAEQ